MSYLFRGRLNEKSPKFFWKTKFSSRKSTVYNSGGDKRITIEGRKN